MGELTEEFAGKAITAFVEGLMTKEKLEKDDHCTCCPYFLDGYCHNCTHEDCEKEILKKGAENESE